MNNRLVGNILWSPLARTMCFVLLVTTFTSGCVAFPISTNNSRALEIRDEVKSMIGESQESVIRKLGLPDQWVSQGEQQLMTYAATSSSEIIVFSPLTPWGGSFTDWGLRCYGVVIDSSNMIKNYKIGSSKPSKRDQRCRNVLTNDWELPNLEIRAMRYIPAKSVYLRNDDNKFLETSYRGFVNNGFLETPYRGTANNDFPETPYRGVTNNDLIDSLHQFKEGDLISMTTNKEITIASRKVTSLKIAVVESDNTKIKGRLSGFLSYVDETMENKIGSIIEIMRSDIEYVWIEETRS